MDVFDKMINNLNDFDMDKYFKSWIEDHSEFITDQNKRRLREKGTDVDGKQIRTFGAVGGNVYSVRSIIERGEEGLPTKHVTLERTGAAFKTMKTNAKSDQFSIEMNTKKPDGDITDNVDVESALGLLELQPLRNLLTIDLRKDLLRVIRK